MKFRKSYALIILIIASLLLVACNNTAYDSSDNIIEAKALKEIYTNEGVVLIDARGDEAYAEAHVKGAICLDPSALTVDKPVVATVAPKAKVERVLGAAGIDNTSEIYIYDDNSFSAARIWWTLKLYGHENVKVVNGGFDALSKAKFPGSKEAAELVKTEYVAKELDESFMVDFEAVKAITEDEATKVKLIDVRSIAEYNLGNIPGSILYPHTNNLYTDGTYMSARDTKLFYQDKDINTNDEIVLYCKSSFRAAQTFLVLSEAGYTNVKIYDGAWLEWEANGGLSDAPAQNAPVTSQDGS